MFKSIIIIIGMPRSGTSWLSQVIDSSPQVRFRLSPFFAYAFKNTVDENSSKEEYERVFCGAYGLEDAFMDQTERRKAGLYPTFATKDDQPEFLAIKDTRFHHLLPRMLELFDNLSMVAIVRHPCGAIHSWLTTPREFPQWADPMQEWRTGACRKTGPEEFWGFEDWKKVTRLHIQLEKSQPHRFKILQYETLVENPIQETQSLFEFLNLKYTTQTEAFLRASQQSHSDDSYAVFKKPDVKDRWREELSPIIQQEIINEIKAGDLARFLS